MEPIAPPILYIPIPSTFHFRASWRSDETSWDAFLTAMHKIIHRDKLRQKFAINPQKGKPLQRVFWEKIAKSDESITQLRKDTITAIEALAQETTLIAAENKNLKRDLIKLKSTKGYRLMEFLRKLG